MTTFRKALITIFGVLVLTGLSFVLQRVLDPERICLHWDGLQSVRFSDEIVQSCEATSRLQRNRIREPLKAWIGRLNHLTRLNWLVDSPRSVSLVIDVEDPYAYELSDRTLTLGYALAEKPGQLERSVLLAWVTRLWPEDDFFTQEIRADLLTWTVVGDASWADPIGAQSVNPADWMRFSLIPQTKIGFCQLPFRSVRELEVCTDNSAFDFRRSARPMIAWTLWSFVRQLPASKQIHFFQSVVTDHQRAMAPSLPEKGKSQEWIQEQARLFLRRWSLGDDVNRRELKKVFYSEELMEPVFFDLTVEVTDRNLSDRTLKSLEKWLEFSPPHRILFVAPGLRMALPEKIALDMPAKEMQTRRHVILACDWPRAKDTLALKSRLFFAVHVCGDDTLPSWREVMNSQPELQAVRE